MMWQIIPKTRNRNRRGRRAQRFAQFIRAVALFGRRYEIKRGRYAKP